MDKGGGWRLGEGEESARFRHSSVLRLMRTRMKQYLSSMHPGKKMRVVRCSLISKSEAGRDAMRGGEERVAES
eukprot:454293-Hanusia_phi.AAC.1